MNENTPPISYISESTHTKKLIDKKSIPILLFCLIIPPIAGWISILFAPDTRVLYEMMNMPPLAPPGWLFGVVWPFLYLGMGFASYMVIRTQADKKLKTTALFLYGLQLAINFTWSYVFFSADQLWLALGIVVTLDVLVLACVILFYRIRKTAAIPLLFYLAWLFFATYLNTAFALIN